MRAHRMRKRGPRQVEGVAINRQELADVTVLTFAPLHIQERTDMRGSREVEVERKKAEQGERTRRKAEHVGTREGLRERRVKRIRNSGGSNC